METIFFEKQMSRLCAQHALNMLLQGAYFSAADLAELARELDDKERSVLSSEAQYGFQSQNVDDSGFFSVQVITLALQRWSNDLRLIPFDSPHAAPYRTNPELPKAYILNLAEHWFVIRRFGKHFFILNSVFDGPRYITPSYLALYLTQLALEGYAIFVVAGDLPDSPADSITDFEVYKSPAAGASADPLDEDLAKAIELSLAEQSSPNLTSDVAKPEEAPSVTINGVVDSEEADLNRAIEESLRGLKGEPTKEGNDEEARQLEMAIKMSLAPEKSLDTLDDQGEQQPCSSRSLLTPRRVLDSGVNVSGQARGNVIGSEISYTGMGSSAAHSGSGNRGALDEETRRKRLEYFDRMEKR